MHDYPCSRADEAMYAADRRSARLCAARQQAKAAHETYYQYQTRTGTVALGHKAIADAQYATDEAAGGLVARICGYGT